MFHRKQKGDTKSKHKYEERNKATIFKGKKHKEALFKYRDIENNKSKGSDMQQDVSAPLYKITMPKDTLSSQFVMFQVYKNTIKIESLCYSTAF